MFHALLNYEIELEWQFVLREPDTTKKTKQGGGLSPQTRFTHITTTVSSHRQLIGSDHRTY